MNRRQSNDNAQSSPPNMSRSSLPRLSTSATAQAIVPPAQSSSSPPQQPPTPAYPLRIPPYKLSKAVKLYERWWLAVREARNATRLAQGVNIHQPAPRLGAQPQLALDVPLSPIARSPTSPTSSYPRRTSVASSAHDGVTESVIEFTENESISSGKANGNGDYTSHTGEKVKAPRGRQPLSPQAKAKAALVRWLGACEVCRFRRVPCPMEHHDIAALEDGRIRKDRRRSLQERAAREAQEMQHRQVQLQLQQQLPRLPFSTLSPTPHQTQLNDSMNQFGGSFSDQSDLLAGMNGQFDGVQSPAATDPSDITLTQDFPLGLINGEQFGQDITYGQYQEGRLIALGKLRLFPRGWAWSCTWSEGYCQESFNDEEQLQLHYENHAAFTRINPPHRYVCPLCNTMNNLPTVLCMSAQCIGTPETRIYGRSKRPAVNQPAPPDDQDYYNSNTWNLESPNNPNIMLTLPSRTNTFNLDGMGGNDYQGMDQGGSSNGYYYQDDTTPQGPSPLDGNYDEFGQQSHNYQYQGSQFSTEFKSSTPTVQWLFTQSLEMLRRSKTILFTAALLFAIAILIETRAWFIAKAQAALLHPNLPPFGFIVMLASFASCYTYCLVRNPSPQDAQGVRLITFAKLSSKSSDILQPLSLQFPLQSRQKAYGHEIIRRQVHAHHLLIHL